MRLLGLSVCILLHLLTFNVFAGVIEVLNKETSPAWPTLTGDPITFMAHRGEKVFMPEHTQASYAIAALEGAEFVEPDLVLTKDLHLVCYHDLTLGGGTDVKDTEFANKIRTITAEFDEGQPNRTIENEWFIHDFTLAELKNLSVIQRRVGIRPQLFDKMFQIPTFEEYLEIVHRNALRLDASVGIIPELKHAKYHNKELGNGRNVMEDKLVESLQLFGYNLSRSDTEVHKCRLSKDNGTEVQCGHLVIQSFELSTLKHLREEKNVSSDTMFLLDQVYRYATVDGMKEVVPYSTYYSTWKEYLYTGIEARLDYDKVEYNKTLVDSLKGFIPPRNIVREAHALGMKVGIYTIYDSHEPSRRGCDVGKCDPENKEMELFYYFDMGVDGMFVENVPEAKDLRTKYQYEVLSKEPAETTTTTANNGMSRTGATFATMAIPILLTNLSYLSGR